MLVVVSIAVLVMYVHHIGRSLRVSALIELVGRDTRRRSIGHTHLIPTRRSTTSHRSLHLRREWYAT